MHVFLRILISQSEASLVDARAAAEVQIRRSAARSAAVVEERCRALEQVGSCQ